MLLRRHKDRLVQGKKAEEPAHKDKKKENKKEVKVDGKRK